MPEAAVWKSASIKISYRSYPTIAFHYVEYLAVAFTIDHLAFDLVGFPLSLFLPGRPFAGGLQLENLLAVNIVLAVPEFRITALEYRGLDNYSSRVPTKNLACPFLGGSSTWNSCSLVAVLSSMTKRYKLLPL